MTVNTTSNRQVHTGDGVTVLFNFIFKIQLAGDMNVYQNGALLVTGYTVTLGADGNGGTVTFDTAPALADDILFVRIVAKTQQTSLPTVGLLDNKKIENSLDKLTMEIQQLQEQVDRAVLTPITNPTPLALVLPNPSANGILAWDGTATFLINTTAANVVAAGGGGGGGGGGPLPNTVYGPGSAVVANTLALFTDATGNLIKGGVAIGTANQVLKSQGAGLPPVFGAVPSDFGGAGVRNCPTIGAVSGEYWHSGDWTSTGAITATGWRLHATGKITLNHPLTVQTELAGGPGGVTAPLDPSAPGSGPGAGYSAMVTNAGPIGAAFAIGGGGGGGHGGNGGNGGAYNAVDLANVGGIGGRTYNINYILAGSSGAAGANYNTFSTGGGGAGGAGGGSLYWEAFGDVLVNADIAANGGNGSAGTIAASTDANGGGGGGSGGGIDIRTAGNLTVNAAKTIFAKGGNGGNSATFVSGGGGGGGGGIVQLAAGGTLTVNGTVDVSGGTKGTSSAANTNAATDGSAGVFIQLNGVTMSRRTAN